MKHNPNIESYVMECKGTKDITHDWITYYDIAKADSIYIDELMNDLRIKHSNDVERIQQYINYCNRIQAETGSRPSHFKPNNSFDLIRLDYQKTRIEFLKAKKSTPRVLLYIAGGAYVHSLTDHSLYSLQHYGEVIGDINCCTCVYRCSPNHSYQETLEDIANTYEWLIHSGYQSENIFLMGDSSGGGTAIAFAMLMRDQKIALPKGMIIHCCYINYNRNSTSYITNQSRDFITGTNHLHDYIDELHIKGHDIHNPYFCPYYGDYKNLPPTLIQVSDTEITYDDSVYVGEKCSQLGTPVHLEIYKNMFHDFALLAPDLYTSRFSHNQVKKFINSLA